MISKLLKLSAKSLKMFRKWRKPALVIVLYTIAAAMAIWALTTYLKIDAAIAAAVAGAVVSVVLTTSLGFWLIPLIEKRKHRYIQEELVRNDIAANLAGLIGSLEYITRFNEFKDGLIIPTHKYSLTRQLNFIVESAESLRKSIERLPKLHGSPAHDTAATQTTLINTCGAADRTKESVNATGLRERIMVGHFKGRNRTALIGHLEEIRKFKEFYELLYER